MKTGVAAVRGREKVDYWKFPNRDGAGNTANQFEGCRGQSFIVSLSDIKIPCAELEICFVHIDREGGIARG